MQYGRYEIVKEVGRGSMGVVYEAHDPNIGRRVALKVLRPDRMGDEAFVKRFLREARAIGRLSHPNIVAVYDVGEDQNVVFIAMEFLEGTPLNDIIRDRRLDATQVIDLGIQAAETLDYAHQKGVVHRDIKPSNIIVQSDGRIKVTDFGIAHIEDASGTVATQVGEIMGTPAYMAPEQVLGKPVDGRTDIFSLGALLYELSAGRRPFGGEGKGLPTIFNEIISVAPQELSSFTSAIPAPISQIIMKCLAKTPEERYQNGKDLADALRAAAQAKAESSASAANPSVPPAAAAVKAEGGKKKSHAALIAVVIAVLFLVGAGAGGYFLYARFKSFVGLEPLRILNLPFMKKSQEMTPAEEKSPVDEAPATPPEEKPAAVALKIESQPSGAEVSVDGDVKGTSPLDLDVPLGAHLVRLTLQGYLNREEEIRIDQAKEYVVSVKLEPVPAKPATEKKTVETSRKGAPKRISTKTTRDSGGSSAAMEQPNTASPPAITRPPIQRVEPKREKPSDGWIIKDLQDR